LWQFQKRRGSGRERIPELEQLTMQKLLAAVQESQDRCRAMPKGVGPLRVKKCLEVMARFSLMASPHLSDDEASITEDLDSDDGLSNLIMGELI
jgi:hypothetical protein